MRDSEKTLSHILKDIEVYKSLRSYASCLKEDNFTAPESIKNVIDFVVKRIDFNARELYSITCEKGENLNPILFQEITHICFISVRCSNALYKAKIIYIGDLIATSKSELLRLQNFGKKCLDEIEQSLLPLNLRVGMDVPGWRPINLKQLVEKYRDIDIQTLVDN